MKSIARVASLRKLVIRGCRQVDGVGVQALAALTQLTHFDARQCTAVHAPCASWTRLEVLQMGRTAFGDADAHTLRGLTQLRELDLQCCKILKR